MNNETPLQKLGRQMAQEKELELYALHFVKWNRSHRLYKKYEGRFIISSAALKSIDKDFNHIG